MFSMIPRFWYVGILLLYSVPTLGQPYPWQRHTIDNSSFGADGTKVCFANPDSLPDIITGWEQGNITRLYFHPGNPQDIWDYVEVPSPDVEDALLADLDQDGFPDIITLSEGKHQRVTVHWAPSDWQEYNQSSLWQSMDIPCTTNQTQWMFGVAWQMDEKHGVDLIVGSKGKNGTIGWLEAPPNPRRMTDWRYHELSSAGWIMSIGVLDINRDSHADILISDRKGATRGVRWLEHPATQEEALYRSWSNHLIGLSEGEPMFLTVTDWNNDDWPDIFVPDLTRQLIRFSQTPGGWVCDSIAYSSLAGTRGKSLVAGDPDQNRSPDLITTYEGADHRYGVMLSTHNTSGWHHYPISDTLGRKFDFARLVDLDQDGDLDVLTSEENNNSATQGGLGVIWYENPLK